MCDQFFMYWILILWLLQLRNYLGVFPILHWSTQWQGKSFHFPTGEKYGERLFQLQEIYHFCVKNMVRDKSFFNRKKTYHCCVQECQCEHSSHPEMYKCTKVKRKGCWKCEPALQEYCLLLHHLAPHRPSRSTLPGELFWVCTFKNEVI